jgi:hypothetical protein
MAFVLALEEGGLAVDSESLQLPSFLGTKLFFKRWARPINLEQWIVDASRQLRGKVRKKLPPAS